MQGFNQHICRYHASAEVHGDDKKRHHKTARPKPALRQHICCRKGHRKIQQRSAYRIQNRISVSHPQIHALQDFPISKEINIFREQGYKPLIYHIGITEGGNHYKVHGVQYYHQCSNCNCRYKNIKNTV